MKNLIENYNLADNGKAEIFGTSVEHRKVFYASKYFGRSSFEGTMLKSKLEVVNKFKSLIAEGKISTEDALDLAELVEKWADEKANYATDMTELDNN
jgi:hypothetical protein